eukprot:TRINITY_DN18375_c0_g2_i7.p1 TRINITY_DN18375_c0_g2~~TRINITY_DN18375_c0_g2_i7.p1  ORF type:complete len:432 (+),score=53.10 TRINITY_DN18375_c0_g2_i7:147-1298(+)
MEQGQVAVENLQKQQQQQFDESQQQVAEKVEQKTLVEEEQQQQKQIQDETSQGQQDIPMELKVRKVRFSGIPKVPFNQQEDYGLSCVGILDQSLSNLIQENELKRKCQETSFQVQAGFQDTSQKQMIQRRLDGIRHLKSFYKEQQWALFDELMVCHRQFCKQGKNVFKKRKVENKSNSNANTQLINSSRQIYQNNQDNDAYNCMDIVPKFDDMEQLILENEQKVNCEELLIQIDTAKSAFQDKIAKILQLEQQVGASWSRRFSEQDAIAGLISKHKIYYLRRSYIIIGRDKKGGGDAVDVNIDNIKISRRQAEIELLKTGLFKLTNIGRREMIVDNQLIERGTDIALKHQSLIEVAGIEMLFVVNQVAVDKVQMRNINKLQKS